MKIVPCSFGASLTILNKREVNFLIFIEIISCLLHLPSLLMSMHFERHFVNTIATGPSPQHLAVHYAVATANAPPIARAPLHQNRTSATSSSSSSLSEITQAFLQYIRNSPEHDKIELGVFCREYNVTKRRIYDITNVMEGVGLVEKRNKNIIAWMGGSLGEGRDTEGVPQALLEDRAEDIEKEIMDMKEEEELLDDFLDRVQPSSIPNKQLYLPFESIRKNYSTKETLLGIRAPRGTMLEVPDPDEHMPAGQRRFQAFLTTPSVEAGVIALHMIQPHVASSKGPVATAVSTTNSAKGKKPNQSQLPSYSKRSANKAAAEGGTAKAISKIGAVPVSQTQTIAPSTVSRSAAGPHPGFPHNPYMHPYYAHPQMYMNVAAAVAQGMPFPPPINLPPGVPAMPPMMMGGNLTMFPGFAQGETDSKSAVEATKSLSKTSDDAVKDAEKAARDQLVVSSTEALTADGTRKRRKLLPKSSLLSPQTKRYTANAGKAALFNMDVQSPMSAGLNTIHDSASFDDCKSLPMMNMSPIRKPSLSTTPPRSRRLMGTPPRQQKGSAHAELETPTHATPLRSAGALFGDLQSPSLNLLETPNAGLSNFSSFQESPITFNNLQSPMFMCKFGGEDDKGDNDDFFERGLFSKSFDSKHSFDKDEDDEVEG